MWKVRINFGLRPNFGRKNPLHFSLIFGLRPYFGLSLWSQRKIIQKVKSPNVQLEVHRHKLQNGSRQTWANFGRDYSTTLYTLLHADTAWHADRSVTTRPEHNFSASVRANNALGVITIARRWCRHVQTTAVSITNNDTVNADSEISSTSHVHQQSIQQMLIFISYPETQVHLLSASAAVSNFNQWALQVANMLDWDF